MTNSPIAPDQRVATRLQANGLVPVVVIDDAARAIGLADALVAGGLPVAEVTLRTDAGLAAIEAMAGRDDLLVGAGTVTSAAQADRAVAAGAKFVVSPGLSRQVVERCAELGVLCVPGTVTATEVQAALELGLNLLKFFPAGTSGGSAAVKALAGPFGGVKFMPTGGVSLNNLAEYLAVPCVAAVGGSWMVPRAAINTGDWATIKELSAAAVKAAAQVKGSAQ
jgi:2-dehydro-3-deoxyphosphogluconate aldolase/(4S)-4-hydroxy-2-oxoglutarate aldolase